MVRSGENAPGNNLLNRFVDKWHLVSHCSLYVHLVAIATLGQMQINVIMGWTIKSDVVTCNLQSLVWKLDLKK